MNARTLRALAAGALVFGAAAGVAAPAFGQFQVQIQTVAGGGSDGDLNDINEAEAFLANPAAGGAEVSTTADVINYADNGFPLGATEDQFALSAVGLVDVVGGTSLSGVVLYVNSDDGFRLRVNNTVVSEFVGPTGGSNTATGPLTLNDGDTIQLTFWERDGGEYVRFRRTDDSGAFIGDPASGIDIVPVPEPAALGVLALGSLGLLARRRRRA